MATPFDAPLLPSGMPDAAPPPRGPVTPAPLKQAPTGPDFAGTIRSVMPIASAMFAGGGSPAVSAAAMVGVLRGRDARRHQQEDEQQRTERRQLEAAKFYHDVLTAAQQSDDEDQLQQELAALKPVAQHYGIDLSAIHVSDQKKVLKAKKDAQATVERLRKIYGADVDTPEWRQGKVIGGRAVDDLFRAAEEPVAMQNNAPVAPRPKVDPPNTSEEQFLARWAQEHGATSFATLPTSVQAAGRQTWMESGRTPAAVAVGSFEDYLTKKYGTTPTPQQIAQAKREYGDSSRAEHAGPGAPTDTQRFSWTERLAGAWAKANAPVKEMDRQLRIMRSGLSQYRNGDRNGGSQSVLVTFQKILDPTSVVRESEYARTTEGQAFLDKLKGRVDRALHGGVTLSDTELAALVKTAEDVFRQMSEWNAGTRRRIEGQAAEYGIKPGLVFDDAIAGDAPTGAPTPALPKVGERRTINGQLGEWDGKGWKAVAR